MENVYEVFSTSGESLGLIVATEEVVVAKYPGRHVFVRVNNPIPPVIITEEFKKRFTEPELSALTDFVATAQKTRLKTFLDILNSVGVNYYLVGDNVDKDKAALVSANVLTTARSEIVFSLYVTPAESPFY